MVGGTDFECAESISGMRTALSIHLGKGLPRVRRLPKLRSMKGYRCHRQRGSISELAAAITLVLPIAIATAFVAVEASQVYMIHNVLNQAASSAARQLAISYAQDHQGTMSHPDAIFANVRYLNIVRSNEQFTVPSGAAGWNVSSDPPTVTVIVKFQGGQHGCADFPNPDPLNLGRNFTFSARATCRLE